MNFNVSNRFLIKADKLAKQINSVIHIHHLIFTTIIVACHLKLWLEGVEKMETKTMHI